MATFVRQKWVAAQTKIENLVSGPGQVEYMVGGRVRVLVATPEGPYIIELTADEVDKIKLASRLTP